MCRITCQNLCTGLNRCRQGRFFGSARSSGAGQLEAAAPREGDHGRDGPEKLLLIGRLRKLKYYRDGRPPGWSHLRTRPLWEPLRRKTADFPATCPKTHEETSPELHAQNGCLTFPQSKIPWPIRSRNSKAEPQILKCMIPDIRWRPNHKAYPSTTVLSLKLLLVERRTSLYTGVALQIKLRRMRSKSPRISSLYSRPI